MTIHDVTNQLYNLTNGRINSETFSKTELQAVLQIWTKTKNKYIMQVELPDGLWLCELTRGSYGYDYYIPDTREQEAALYKALGIE